AEAGPSKQGCRMRQPAGGATAVCPAHPSDRGIVVDNEAESRRLRRALRDGIFLPWVELGRAPTAEEVAQRLKLPWATPKSCWMRWRRAGRSSRLAFCGSRKAT